MLLGGRPHDDNLRSHALESKILSARQRPSAAQPQYSRPPPSRKCSSCSVLVNTLITYPLAAAPVVRRGGDLCLEVLGRDPQSGENRLDDVVVGQRLEEVLAVH